MFKVDLIKNIVIFMPRFLGDCINCTPSISLLKEYYPECKVHLVIRKSISRVFDNESDLNFIYDERQGNKVNGSLELIRQLKAIDVSACILMTNTLQDSLITYLARIKIRIGYNTEQRGIFLTDKLKFDRNRHYINRYAYLANLLCNNHFKKLPEVKLTSDPANSKLSKTSGFKVGLCILSGYKHSRHYPIKQTVELIKLLNLSIDKPTRFTMLGSEEEQITAEEVVNDCQRIGLLNVDSSAGQTTVAQLIDDIAALDILITVDSGPLHIAAATSTPTVALHTKGTSPFSLVCPKSQLVVVVNTRGGYIDDKEQTLDLLPTDIEATVLSLMKSINDNTVEKETINELSI